MLWRERSTCTHARTLKARPPKLKVAWPGLAPPMIKSAVFFSNKNWTISLFQPSGSCKYRSMQRYFSNNIQNINSNRNWFRGSFEYFYMCAHAYMCMPANVYVCVLDMKPTSLSHLSGLMIFCNESSTLNYLNASLWVPTNDAYWPPWASNSKWVPSSAILPSEQTAIWCAFCTVLNLWAITKVVLPFIRWLSASWTRRSLTASNALVAWTR